MLKWLSTMTLILATGCSIDARPDDAVIVEGGKETRYYASDQPGIYCASDQCRTKVSVSYANDVIYSIDLDRMEVFSGALDIANVSATCGESQEIESFYHFLPRSSDLGGPDEIFVIIARLKSTDGHEKFAEISVNQGKVEEVECID